MLAVAIVVLIELFTAEGCSSCPPADRLLEAMIATQPAAGVEIVGLGEHVDYWNARGWKDRFSSAAFTERQQGYVDRLATSPTVYTPQMVVDGQIAFVGSDVAAARAAIERAATLPHGSLRLELSAPSTRDLDVLVTVDALPPIDNDDRAEVVVAVIESGLQSDVKKGENAGKILTHAAVARSLTAIGPVAGSGSSVRGRLKMAADWNRERVKVIAFVQERRSRRVLATAISAPPSSKSASPEAR